MLTRPPKLMTIDAHLLVLYGLSSNYRVSTSDQVRTGNFAVGYARNLGAVIAGRVDIP